MSLFLDFEQTGLQFSMCVGTLLSWFCLHIVVLKFIQKWIIPMTFFFRENQRRPRNMGIYYVDRWYVFPFYMVSNIYQLSLISSTPYKNWLAGCLRCPWDIRCSFLETSVERHGGRFLVRQRWEVHPSVWAFRWEARNAKNERNHIPLFPFLHLRYLPLVCWIDLLVGDILPLSIFHANTLFRIFLVLWSILGCMLFLSIC